VNSLAAISTDAYLPVLFFLGIAALMILVGILGSLKVDVKEAAKSDFGEQDQ
jgi:sensor domain CHASE-containing protein